jgi:AraC family transcriptional regulator
MPSERELLALLHAMSSHRDEDWPLDELSARAGWSPFHLHRAFRRVVGETPKQYMLRVRLERAAARLVSGSDDETILDIALSAGFESHEVFARAFRRQYGVTPSRYRADARRDSTLDQQARAAHRAVIEGAGPCIGLFHLPLDDSRGAGRRSHVPTLSIDRQQLTEQPLLFVRTRAARHELPTAISQCFRKVFPLAQRAGYIAADRPLTRYVSNGPGLLTIEAGVPLRNALPGEGEVEAGTLPAGPAAVAVHAGPYDQLVETYAAIERWVEANGYRVHATQAPWESYTTDPGDHPDPADWRTHVYWPLAE